MRHYTRAFSGNSTVFLVRFATFGCGGSRSILALGITCLAVLVPVCRAEEPVANDDEGRVNSDQVLTGVFNPPAGSVLANDTNGNTGDTLTVVDYDASSEAGATVTMAADGTFTYDPRNVPAFQALTYWDRANDAFTYTVSDGTDTDIATVRVEVYGPEQDFEGEAGANLTLTILEPEAGAAWLLGETVTLRGEARTPMGVLVSCTGHCQWTLREGDEPAVTLRPDAGDGSLLVAGLAPGSYTLTYVIDPIHQHAHASISVTIEAGNLPEQAMHLLNRFLSRDADDDGELSLEEVQALTAEQFSVVDVDRNRALSVAELERAMAGGYSEECTDNSVVGQLPGPFEALATWNSSGIWNGTEAQPSGEILEKFHGAGRTITSMRWWGFFSHDDGPVLMSKGEGRLFRVTFYTSENDKPAVVIGMPTGIGSRGTSSVALYSDYGQGMYGFATRFERVFESPIELPDEPVWVGIQLIVPEIDGEGIWFDWLESGTGDQMSYRRWGAGEVSYENFDLAFCLGSDGRVAPDHFQPVILAPEDGAVWRPGDVVELRGELRDANGAAVEADDDGYRWTLLREGASLPSQIGFSREVSFEVAAVANGNHTLTLSHESAPEESAAEIAVVVEGAEGESETCLGGSAFSQLPGRPSEGEDWAAASLHGFRTDEPAVEANEAFEMFTVAGDTVTAVRWWGLYQSDEGPSLKGTGEAEPSDYLYRVTFYQDEQGAPAEVIGTATGTPTEAPGKVGVVEPNSGGVYYGEVHQARRFDLPLETPIALPAGIVWIGLQFLHDATESEGLDLLWLSSPTGDAQSTISTANGLESQAFDLSLCIATEAGEAALLAAIAVELYSTFVDADTDSDSQLSFSEALSSFSSLTQAQFSAMDTDDDGFLSEAEIAAQIAAGEGEGEGEGEGCMLPTTAKDLRSRLGDFFLMGLALTGLAIQRGTFKR